MNQIHTYKLVQLHLFYLRVTFFTLYVYVNFYVDEENPNVPF